MKYNKNKKRYQCAITMDREIYRKATLEGICVTDIYGNEKAYIIDYTSDYTPKKKTRKYYNAYKKMTVMVK